MEFQEGFQLKRQVGYSRIQISPFRSQKHAIFYMWIFLYQNLLITNLACFSCQVVDQSSVLGITQYMCGTLPDWVGLVSSHIYRELEGVFKSNSHHSGKHLR